MKKWIRRLLGIDELLVVNAALRRDIKFTGDDVLKMKRHIDDMRSDLLIFQNQLANVVLDEHHPFRMELSQRLGSLIEARLKAEELARRMTEQGNG